MADKPILEEKFNKELDVDQKLNEGGVLGKIYLEVQGNDLEAAKVALQKTIYDRLKAEKNAHVLEVKMYDIQKDEGDFFSGVAEVNFVADDFRWFVNTVMRYGPAAVEVIEPSDVQLDSAQMHSIIADVSDFTHMYSQQIIAMFKDPERRALYERMLEGEQV
jgi:hypothetical protein